MSAYRDSKGRVIYAQDDAFGDHAHAWEPAHYPMVRPVCGKTELLLKVWDFEAAAKRAKAPRCKTHERCPDCLQQEEVK